MKMNEYQYISELTWGCVPVDKAWATATLIYNEMLNKVNNDSRQALVIKMLNNVNTKNNVSGGDGEPTTNNDPSLYESSRTPLPS